MCEQAARYCRAGVQKLLRKPAPALRGLDGLLRWAAGRMGDKGLADRELLAPGAAAAQRKGTSVILDVSAPRSPHPAPRTARSGDAPRSCAPRRARLQPGSCSPRLGVPHPPARVPHPPQPLGISVICWEWTSWAGAAARFLSSPGCCTGSAPSLPPLGIRAVPRLLLRWNAASSCPARVGI